MHHKNSVELHLNFHVGQIHQTYTNLDEGITYLSDELSLPGCCKKDANARFSKQFANDDEEQQCLHIVLLSVDRKEASACSSI